MTTGNWNGLPARGVRYAKFEWLQYFIAIDILQNLLIDIDIDINIFANSFYGYRYFQNGLMNVDINIFQIGRPINYRYQYSIFHQ